MRSIVILTVFIFSVLSSPAQDILFFGGLNCNRFCDYKKNSANFNTIYSSLSGHNAGIGIDNVMIRKISFSFMLRMTNYKGNIYTAVESAEGGNTTKTAIKKQCIGLGIYPLNLKILSNKLNFSVGAEFSALTNATVKEYQSSWPSTSANNNLPPTRSNPKLLMNEYNYGLASKLAYKIQLKNDFFIMPQYSFFLGLSDEFRNIETNTKSYRHLLEIGIVKRLKGRVFKTKD